MFWAQTAAGVWASKSCAFGGTKAPHPLPTFQLQLQPSQLSKSLFKASTKWTSQTVLHIASLQRHWHCFSQIGLFLSNGPIACCKSQLNAIGLQTRLALLQRLLWSPALGELDCPHWGRRSDVSQEAKPQEERPWVVKCKFSIYISQAECLFWEFFSENAPRSFWESRCTSF